MPQRVMRALLGRKPSTIQPADVEHRRLHEIHFPRNLTAVIRRERARADRQKSQFSLVMFRQVPARGRWATLRLCRMVLNQVRVADEVGQFDRHTVCAILPDTGPDGAWKLIERVADSANNRKQMIEPVVYTYPTSWLDKPGDDEGGMGSEGDDNGTSDRAQADRSVSAIAGEIANETGQSNRSQTLPLRRLLLRRPSITKRLLDLSVAAGVLAATAPLMALFAVLIKTTSDGPVVFKQWRSGLGGRPFEIYKFRTMCANADALKAQLRSQSEQDGPAFKMTRDPRVTAVGQFLRKTSLDELPQLLNVLKGDMSLVGPRPLPLDEQAQCDQWHKGRLDVMPGLTCIWQVHGRSRVSFEDWMRMDLKYIRRYEVLHDIKLMFQTIPAVLLRRGAK